MIQISYVSKHGNAGIRGNENDIWLAIWLYQRRRRSVTGIARALKCNNTTIVRLLRENGIPTLHNGKARGSKNWNWKGGKTKTQEYIRFSPEYKAWRKMVFERDNYTCVLCSNGSGGNLEADHIEPQSQYPELRFDINNGRTLCKECHRKTPTYGEKAKHYKRKFELISADFMSS